MNDFVADRLLALARATTRRLEQAKVELAHAKREMWLAWARYDAHMAIPDNSETQQSETEGEV